MLLTAYVVARRTDAAGRAGYIRQAVIYREAAGVATILSTVDTPLTRESDNQWDCTIDVDGGNNARIRVTGRLGRTINWKSQHFVDEVS